MHDKLENISGGPAPAGVPAARDGEVRLPETRRAEPGSAPFLEAVSACLPADVAGTVAARQRNSRRGYRRVEVIAIVLALAGAAWFVHAYFPKPLPALPFKFEWRYEGPRLMPDSPYYALYRKARADFDAGRGEAVIRTLNDPLGVMLWERSFAGQDELFYIYFVSCGRTVSRFTDWTRARSFAEELVKADPDNLQWRYFKLLLERRHLGGCREFYDTLRRQRCEDWRLRLGEVGLAIGDLRDLRGKVRELRTPPGDEAEIMKQLDLWEAEFLVFAWMLEGGRGGAAFPDDAGKPGVEAREEAWLLTRKHEDDRSALAFLKLQLFILDVLLEQDSLLNTIYWCGKPHSARMPLEAKREAILRRLPAGEGGLP